MTIREFLNNHNYNIEEEINLKIIGITGSVAKSSIAYIIYKYLVEEQHKNVAINSSICSNYDELNYSVGENELVILNKNDLADIIYKSYIAGAEYLILECHFISLEANIFEDIPFAVRTITYTCTDNFADMEDELYFACKRKLIENNNGGAVLLNLCDPALSFHQQSFSADEVFYIDYGTPNLPWPRNKSFNSYDEYYAEKRQPQNLPYPQYFLNYALNGVKSSFAKFSVNEKNFESWVKLSLYFGVVNTLHAAAMLDILGEFDVSKFIEFLEDFDNIPGRGEIFELEDNKLVVLDLSSFDYTKALKEWRTLDPVFDGILTSELKDQADRFGGVNFQRLEVVAPLVITNQEVIDATYRLFPGTKMNLSVTDRPLNLNASKYNNFADFAYFTPISPGSVNMIDFFDIYKNKIIIPYTYINDRGVAIDTAIRNMQPNTILVIPGRGRRRIYRDNKSVKYKSDYDQIISTINSLEMEDDNNETI